GPVAQFPRKGGDFAGALPFARQRGEKVGLALEGNLFLGEVPNGGLNLFIRKRAALRELIGQWLEHRASVGDGEWRREGGSSHWPGGRLICFVDARTQSGAGHRGHFAGQLA